jgi:hypothetical protein
MKPAEILGLIEEAAGTRMYQTRKEHALKTIADKDKKRVEIDQLLENNIKPEIEKLHKEKKHYMEYTNKQREIQEKNRFVIAFDYHRAQVCYFCFVVVPFFIVFFFFFCLSFVFRKHWKVPQRKLKINVKTDHNWKNN